MEEQNTLYVQMFGNFRMKYGEKPLTGEKLRDTYFTSLMQILLHNVSEGVSRDYLEDVLFNQREGIIPRSLLRNKLLQDVEEVIY